MKHYILLRIAGVAGILFLATASDAGAKDEPRFGPAIDAFCTSENRIPATPYANGKSSLPTSECQLCHKPFTFDKINVAEGFNQWKLATKPENLRPDGTPDFSWFCPDGGAANSAPVMDPVGSQQAAEGRLLELLISASDPDGDALAFAASNIPLGARLDDNGDATARLSWTPGFDQSGNYAVTLIVTDDGMPPESDSETITITVGDVNRPPVLEPVGNWSAAEGERIQIPVLASDPDGDALLLEAANLPAGATFSDAGDGTGLFDWTSGFDQTGNFAVTFIVSDDGNPLEQDAEEILISVGAVNRPPILEPIGDRMLNEGEMLELALRASDPDGDGLLFEVMDPPEGSVLTDNGDGSAQFAWAPAAGQTGSFTVGIVVSDDGVPVASDSEEIVLTVGDMNRPPSLDPIGNRATGEGDLLQIMITASDPDGDALRFAADPVPAGATLVDHGDGTAEFSWSPTPDQLGSMSIGFEVSDNGVPTGSDGEKVTITVNPASETQPGEGAPTIRRARARNGRLIVEGRASAWAPVVLLDSDSGALLGSTVARRWGAFRFRLYLPSSMPCTVEAFAGETSSAPAQVVGCMQGSGRDLRIRRATWNRRTSRLALRGSDGPYYGFVDLHDADTGDLLGSTRVDARGRFSYRATLPDPPCRVSAQAGDYAFGPVAVRGVAASCAAE